jgi:pimeloyl-ACP methyl ester carboxylesterase
MGGLGALLAANRHPELVDGIILLSPFVGDASVVAQVRDAGGLAEWTPPEHTGEWTEGDYTLRLWTWLRGYVTDPDGMPPLWIGWGEGEDLEGPDSVLAAALPEGHVFHIPGRHAWSTWRPLFREVLASARPGR